VLWRWLRAGDLDVNELRVVDEYLSSQVARGQRLCGLRDAFARRRLARGAANPLTIITPSETPEPWVVRLLAACDAEWAPYRTAERSAGDDVAALDRTALLVAALLTSHRRMVRKAPGAVFDAALRLEDISPQLLDGWLTILTLSE